MRPSDLLTCDGKTQSARAWAAELGICWQTIAYRLRIGGTLEHALQPRRTKLRPCLVRVNRRKR
jgi:hypothetical protein